MRDDRDWLARGIARVILGTAAVRDPGFVREACVAFPAALPSGIDARGGKVAVEGWAETQRADGAGPGPALRGRRRRGHHLHRHRARRRPASGLNLPATVELARSTSIPVIASGGLAGLDDVKALLEPRYAMLEGAIAGRALYDGRLDAAQALRLIAQSRRHGT